MSLSTTMMVGNMHCCASSGYTLILLVAILWSNRNVSSFLPFVSISASSTCISNGRLKTSSVSNHCHFRRNYRQYPALRRTQGDLRSKYEDENEYASKGIVSIMTNLVNTVVDGWSMLFRRSESSANPTTLVATSNGGVGTALSPSSSQELLDRVSEDYTIKNYLWTGDLDLASNFERTCRFTDPTLSFVGTEQYAKNIRNLRPILNLLTNVSDCRSDLLHIQSTDRYIQTRWNMIGTLTGLPWRPKIDVIGRTKFWYNNDTFQIYFYDEVWEIPASQALLQLITPAGTVPSSSV
jgi:Uncharacterized conserved protein (DUF2358)